MSGESEANGKRLNGGVALYVLWGAAISGVASSGGVAVWVDRIYDEKRQLENTVHDLDLMVTRHDEQIKGLRGVCFPKDDYKPSGGGR